MKMKAKTGAKRLRGGGTFFVKCSRKVTESLTISQKGGLR